MFDPLSISTFSILTKYDYIPGICSALMPLTRVTRQYFLYVSITDLTVWWFLHSVLSSIKVNKKIYIVIVVDNKQRSIKVISHRRHDVSYHQQLDCLLDNLFRPTSKKTWQVPSTAPCEVNPGLTGGLSLKQPSHCNDVIMSAMEFQITSLTIVYSRVYSDADQRKHQSSALLAFVRGIHRLLVNPRTKGQ